MAEYNIVKSALQQSERKAQGNLMVRGLTDIVGKDDMRGTIGSDWMSTVLLVIPKNGFVIPKNGFSGQGFQPRHLFGSPQWPTLNAPPSLAPPPQPKGLPDDVRGG